MDIPWEDARLFLAVAETGSLSAAARQLHVAQPTVSRRLAELEARLGEPLFVRGVEGAALTDFGERLLEPARRMAEWAAELARAAEKSAAPRGVVRVTAPPGVAFELLVPFAAALRARLPEVQLEVLASVRYLDLSRREADLALRAQKPTQRDLVTVASLEFLAVPFVAPSYLARLGKKRVRLAEVDWIAWAPPFDELLPNTALARLIPGFRPAFSSDDFIVQIRAAEMGLGAIFLGRARHPSARANPLVELAVADFPPVPSALHLVCAKSALAIPRVRAVADLLAAEFARTDTRRR